MLIVVGILAAALLLSHAAPFPGLLEIPAGDLAMWEAPRRADGPHVYLTFDDGPNPTATPALLDLLDRESVTATFFVIDKWVTPDTAPLVRRMFDGGHGVALHSHTRQLALMDADTLAETLRRAAQRISQLTGHDPCHAFRPHAGFRSLSMYAGLRKADFTMVGWGWNLWDWNWFRPKRPTSIAPRLGRLVSDGSIVVIHDGHHKNQSSDRQRTIAITQMLIPQLKTRGFKFGSVCDVVAAA
jgi:peptidoglycan-N-acetylglucosamine deacetylase